MDAYAEPSQEQQHKQELHELDVYIQNLKEIGDTEALKDAQESRKELMQIIDGFSTN